MLASCKPKRCLQPFRLPCPVSLVVADSSSESHRPRIWDDATKTSAALHQRDLLAIETTLCISYCYPSPHSGGEVESFGSTAGSNSCYAIQPQPAAFKAVDLRLHKASVGLVMLPFRYCPWSVK